MSRPPDDRRQELLAAPATWLARQIDDPLTAARAEAAVAGAAAWFGAERVHRALLGVRSGPPSGSQAADPVLRAIVRAWIGAVVTTTVDGAARAAVVGTRPVVALSNHLSFADTTATECALLRAGGAARVLADRMWALAGPKVWEVPLHALASSALNLIPTSQSRRIDADSDPAAALRALSAARAQLSAGDPLLIYAEGTRARARRLGPLLAGVRHYLTLPGTVVLPIALTGTDLVFPVGAHRLTPGPVHLRVGDPIDVDDPLRALVEAHRALAELLPDGYRPAAGTPPVV